MGERKTNYPSDNWTIRGKMIYAKGNFQGIRQLAVMILIFMVAFTFLIPQEAYASDTVTGTVNSPNGVNVRSGAGTSYGIVTAIVNGAKVDVTGQKKDSDGFTWYQISYKGKNGYVRSDLIKVSNSSSSSSSSSDSSSSGGDFVYDGAAVAAYADKIFKKNGYNWTHDCVKYARMCMEAAGISAPTGGNAKMSGGLVDLGYADKYELYVTKSGRVPVKGNEGKIGLGDLIENYCPGKNCSRGYYHANIVVGTTTIDGVEYWVVNSHSKSGSAVRYHEDNIAAGRSGKNYRLTTCCGSRVVLYCFHFRNNSSQAPSGSLGSSSSSSASLPADTNVTSSSPKTENGVENTTISLKSSKTKKGGIKLSWSKSAGYKVDYYEVFRSIKKNSGYGKRAYYKSSSGKSKIFTNTSNLTSGTRYYYKVRGVRILKGKNGGTVKIFTKWSNKVSRIAG